MTRELRKVFLIHTGGTFGMRVDAGSDRVLPSQDEYLGDLLERVPELRKLAHLELRILCGIDSSDMTGELWKKIAESVVERWDDFDGFVVVHGTDTMAYTAAALSFFLASLTKPIVLTGSQRPLSELRSDARSNIIDAVELATMGIPEIMICFDSKVHRGTRVTKYSSEHMRAFRGYNSSLLGHFGVHFNLNGRMARKPVPEACRHRPILDGRLDPRVISLDCIPGVDLPLSVRDALLDAAAGLVIRGFGSGNLPTAGGSWVELCEKALARSIPVVMATQCSAGTVSLTSYANGRAFVERGVISGGDMSFESLVVKLMVMLGRRVPFVQRHRFFATPLAEECAPSLDDVAPTGASHGAEV